MLNLSFSINRHKSVLTLTQRRHSCCNVSPKRRLLFENIRVKAV